LTLVRKAGRLGPKENGRQEGGGERGEEERMFSKLLEEKNSVPS